MKREEGVRAGRQGSAAVTPRPLSRALTPSPYIPSGQPCFRRVYVSIHDKSLPQPQCSPAYLSDTLLSPGIPPLPPLTLSRGTYLDAINIEREVDGVVLPAPLPPFPPHTQFAPFTRHTSMLSISNER